MAEKERAKKKCGAKTRNGGSCKWPAGWGTKHVGYGACKLHGGSVPTHQIAAKKEMAREAVENYGLPRAVEPTVALTEELHRTAGHVAWLASVVRELEESETTGPVGQRDETHHPRHEPSVWIRLYQEERKHLKDVAKTCLEVGIEERIVRVAEEQGQLLAQAVQAILTKLGIPLEAPATRAAIREAFTAVEGTARELTTASNGSDPEG